MSDTMTLTKAVDGAARPGIASLALSSLRAHTLILLVPLAFLCWSNWLTSDLVNPQRAPFIALLGAMVTIAAPTALVAAFFVRLYLYATVIKPVSAIRQFAADTRYLATTRLVWLNALPVVAAMLIHNKAALELKAAIPALNPFSWDQTFIEIDRLLHFGMDPWRILQPVLGYPNITFMLNNLYNFWFVLMFGMWFWFAFQNKHSALRDQFFIAFSLTWMIGGGIMALIFSSAGPVYLSDLGFEAHPFVELMAYLHNVNDNIIPLWAVDAQRALWDGYTNPDVPFVGISAFPSMHNAVVAAFTCAAWSINRRLGMVIAAYAALILLGSVHLGWHYAVDGYAGILIGVICWRIAGHIAAWHERQPWVQEWRSHLDQ